MCNSQNREAATELPGEGEIQTPFELQFTDSWCRLPPMTLPFPRAACIVPGPCCAVPPAASARGGGRAVLDTPLPDPHPGRETMRLWAAGEERVSEGGGSDKAKGTHCSGVEIED